MRAAAYVSIHVAPAIPDYKGWDWWARINGDIVRHGRRRDLAEAIERAHDVLVFELSRRVQAGRKDEEIS